MAANLADPLRGAIPLLEVLRFPNHQLGRGVVEIMIQESPLIRMIPFITLTGEAYVARHERDLPSVEFRKVNEGYDRNWGTFDKSMWGITILGGEVFVDNFMVRTRPGDDVKARQYAAKSKAAALTFDKYAIDGDGTNDSFRGLNWMAANGWGQQLDAGGGFTFDILDLAIDMCRVKTPDAMLMNRSVRRGITALARNFPGGAFPLIDVGTSTLGQQVMSYDGVPFAIIGDGPDGQPILANNETALGAKPGGTKTSIYVVCFGDEENVFGILGAGGSMEVVDFGEIESAPGHLGRLEFYPGLACLTPYALVRVFNVGEPTITVTSFGGQQAVAGGDQAAGSLPAPAPAGALEAGTQAEPVPASTGGA